VGNGQKEDLAMKHGFPKDDAWKQCTVRGIVDDGNKLWLHCYGCHRHRYADAREWVEKNNVDLDMPLLLIGRRIRCTRCNRRTVTITAAPYSNLRRDPAAPKAVSTATCPVCRSTDIEKSPPLRRPFLSSAVSEADRFLPYTIMVECECNACTNWWTQPRDLSFASQGSRDSLVLATTN
jgi:hypothetical protein